MATETASFALELDARGNGAADMAGQLEDLRDQIDGGVRQMREMQKALRNMRGAASPNVDMMEQLKAKIAAQKTAIASAQESYVGLGGTFERTRRPAQAYQLDLNSLLQQATELPGPLGAIAKGLQGASLKAAAGVASVAALAAVYVALAAAVVTATVKLAAYGIAQSGARRSELQRLEGLTKIRDWWGRPAGDARAMQQAVDDVSASYALGRGEVVRYQEELYRAGLRGQALRDALEGITLTASTQGDREAQVFKNLALGAAYAGRSVKDLTEDAKARLGGLAARQMLDVDVQARKIRESFSRITDGLNLEPLLNSLNSVTSLFSQSEASGRALKVIFEAAFQPLIDSTETAGPIFKRFFQGLIIGGLVFTIAILKVRNALRDMLPDGVLDNMDAASTALTLGKIAAAGLATALTLAVVGFALLAAPVVLVANQLLTLYRSAVKVKDFFTQTDWGELADDLIEGLVNGIKGGAKKVANAVRSLGQMAKDAFKGEMLIRSPSQIFFGYGDHLPGGAALGVRAGTPKLTAAIRGMGRQARQEGENSFSLRLDRPVIPTGERRGEPRQDDQGARDRRSDRRPEPRGPLIGQLHLHAASGSTEEQAKDLWDQLADYFEDLGVQVGARGAT